MGEPLDALPGLRVERHGPVLTIWFDRPEQRNSFTPTIARGLHEILRATATDREARVLVLRGAGHGAFSAGYDIGALADLASEGILPLEANDPYELAYAALLEHPLPTIAMVAGWAMGGGCSIAVGCDVRLAGESARFGMPPARLGVLYGHRDLRPFLDVIGPAWTRYLFFSGRVIDAPTALRIGLAHEVLPDDELERATYALAEEIAANAPLSVQGTKRVLHLMQPPLDANAAAEIESLMRAAQTSEDMQEGRRAFLEKRKPEFKGR